MLKTACFKLWVLPIPRELRAARGGFFLPLHLVSPSVVAQRQLGSGLCPVILSKPPHPPAVFEQVLRSAFPMGKRGCVAGCSPAGISLGPTHHLLGLRSAQWRSCFLGVVQPGGWMWLDLRATKQHRNVLLLLLSRFSCVRLCATP